MLGRGEPAVVLVHGWCENADYWQAQFDILKSRYTVVALDLAGHGASGANRTDWSVLSYAADVATIAKQIPNAHLVLVGHSMGADVALAALPRIGARVIGRRSPPARSRPRLRRSAATSSARRARW